MRFPDAVCSDWFLIFIRQRIVVYWLAVQNIRFIHPVGTRRS